MVNLFVNFREHLSIETQKEIETEMLSLADAGFSKRLFNLCGLAYRSFDIFEADGVTLFDLNRDELNVELKESFDLVTNFGTTEHVVNQFLAMKSIHEAVALNGLIYHDLPMGGYLEHGYFCYTPLLFRDIAKANDYEIVFHAYSKGGPTVAPRYMFENGYPETSYINFGIEVIFRKTALAPFRLPLELSTSVGLDPSFSDRYDLQISSANALLLADKINTNHMLSENLSISDSMDLSKVRASELVREFLYRLRRRVTFGK